MKTIICDIDGTILKHKGSQHAQIVNTPELLPGVLEKFHSWDKLGYTIILISGRREGTRETTEQQLRNIGIIYDQLILGAGRGQRVLINDLKPESKTPTAVSINVIRNVGMESLKVQ